jgi:hypothetical protein
MDSRKTTSQRKSNGSGTLDGGEGRGVPLDEVRDEEDVIEPVDPEVPWEEEDPADRRRDPLRK